MLQISEIKLNAFIKANTNFNINYLDYAKIEQNNETFYDLTITKPEDYHTIKGICIDQTKQGKEEKNQHEILNIYAKKIINTAPFQTVPKRGSKRLFIKNGKIKPSAELKNTLKNFLLEDIDFISGNYIVFCKHTSNEGGGQNDQEREAANFINHCPKINNIIKGIILLSGTFWTTQRVDQLKKWAKKKSCSIFTNEEMLALEGMSDE